MSATFSRTEEIYLLFLENGVLDVYANNYIAMFGPHILDADISKESLESRLTGEYEVFFIDPSYELEKKDAVPVLPRH